MNWKMWIPFVLALAMGLLAAKVGRDVILRSGRNSGPGIKLEKVVVVRGDLDPGHVLEEGDLALADSPAAALPRTAFGKVQDVVGRVLLQSVVKGQVVLDSLLAPAGAQGGPQALIPAGMRAIKIEVNEVSGVAGLLAPGCHVDIVTTFPTEKNSAVARVIVQDVKVLAVGQRVVSLAKAEKPDDGLVLAKSVTLLVTPRDAQAIELSATAGRARLVLRSPLDRESPELADLTVAELLGKATPVDLAPERTLPQTRPAEVVVRPAPEKKYRTVEVINGTEITTVRYEVPEDRPTAITNTPDGPLFPGR